MAEAFGGPSYRFLPVKAQVIRTYHNKALPFDLLEFFLAMLMLEIQL